MPSIMSPLILLLLLSAVSSASADTCNHHDQRVLLAIKYHFNRHPYFSSWTPTAPCCGSWQGIGCTDGRVTSLAITNANMSGPIPLAIFDLPLLKTLVLTNLPNFYGSFHHQFNLLINLQFLTISHTGMEGPVLADTLFTLTNLQQIDLSYNGFYGYFPAVLATLPDLFLIDLSGNHFKGPLPTGLFAKSPQPYLRLANNVMSGAIPADFGGLDFIEIDLSGNRFVGDASLLFGSSKPTQKINLSKNQFRFNLSNIQFPQPVLMELDLSHNEIYGKIPHQITKLKNLNKLDLSYNNLCGRIPLGGALMKFGESSFAHNKCLCGSPLSPCK